MQRSDQTSEARDGFSATKVYGVPRQYDLATLFAVSIAYAIMFGVMRALNFSPDRFAISAAFVTLVGIGQALLFKGKSPRTASIVVGATLPVAIILLISVFRFSPSVVNSIQGSFCSAFSGAILGYAAGTLVSGVFLVADAIRTAMQKWKER